MRRNPDKPIYEFCPLCDSRLEGSAYGSFSTCPCPNGHYIWQGNGSYASIGIIIIDGKQERFDFDDCFDDSNKFFARVEEIRNPKVPKEKDIRSIVEPFEPSIEQ